MHRQLFEFLCSSAPRLFFSRLLLLAFARSVLSLYLSYAQNCGRFCSLHSSITLAILGPPFVTGCPARQLTNLIWNLLLLESKEVVAGPILAKASRIWKIWHICRGDWNITIRKMHYEYGAIVQIAPNEYSFSDPEIIDQIYRGAGANWRKADWYLTGGPADTETKSLFSNRDSEAHAKVRRRLAPAYRREQIAQLGSLLDGPLKELQYVLDGAAKKGNPVNLAELLELFAFDATGALTNGKGFGALRGNHVPPIVLEAINTGILYVSVIGNIAEWHTVLFSLMQFPGVPNMLPLVEDFIERNTGARLEDDRNDGKTADMLSRFLPTALSQSSPKETHEALRQMVETNTLAAADTTSTAMCAAIYYLAGNPAAMKRLREELQDHDTGERVGIPANIGTDKLPYLDSVIKEAMRLHPGVGMNMPRVVPKGGAFIGENHFRAGAIVGTNAWLMHHDASIWGSDHDDFRPERWLTDDADAFQRMNRTFFSFGAGSRECIGKYIAFMEVQRLLALVVSRYNLDIEESGVAWNCMQFTQYSKLLATVSLHDQGDDSVRPGK